MQVLLLLGGVHPSVVRVGGVSHLCSLCVRGTPRALVRLSSAGTLASRFTAAGRGAAWRFSAAWFLGSTGRDRFISSPM